MRYGAEWFGFLVNSTEAREFCQKCISFHKPYVVLQQRRLWRNILDISRSAVEESVNSERATSTVLKEIHFVLTEAVCKNSTVKTSIKNDQVFVTS